MCARESLAYDALLRRTRFIEPCTVCGGYKEVIGSLPIFLKDVFQALPHGIFRTDLEFGSGRQKGPVLLMGLDDAEFLKQKALRGLTLLPFWFEETLH